jgi:hypothetical protein
VRAACGERRGGEGGMAWAWTWPNASPSWRASAHSATHAHGRLSNGANASPKPTPPSLRSKCNIITIASVKPRIGNQLTLQAFDRRPLRAGTGWRRNLKAAVLNPAQTRENRGGTASYDNCNDGIAARRTGRNAGRRL